jgi:hypothetical protein
LAAAALATAGLAPAPQATPTEPRAQPAPADLAAPGAPFALTGTSSCSGRACHGGLEPLPGKLIRRNEYTTWLYHDKHARAFDVLHNERSEGIARNLAAKTGKLIPAHKDVRCLACHVTPALANGTAKDVVAMREDGVGCEACHGPAEKWRAPHTNPTAWAETKARLGFDGVKRQYGMVVMEDLAHRAQVCAGCHVGAGADNALGLPVRDVNHDLIAAGHPRLNFEFGAFLANMPKHWLEPHEKRKDEKAGQVFDAKVWAVGQAATAMAALELLEHRAQATDQPWPEFTEYDCFACHHDLSQPSWRQSKAHYGQRLPGSLPWGTWLASMPRALAAQPPFQAPEVVKALEELERFMATPYPDRQGVARLAQQAAGPLNTWLAQIDRAAYDQATVNRLMKGLAGDHRLAAEGWDGAAQFYLAVAALNQAYPNDQVRQATQAMSNALAFPAGQDSPKGVQPAGFGGELRKHLKQLPD